MKFRYHCRVAKVPVEYQFPGLQGSRNCHSRMFCRESMSLLAGFLPAQEWPDLPRLCPARATKWSLWERWVSRKTDGITGLTILILNPSSLCHPYKSVSYFWLVQDNTERQCPNAATDYFVGQRPPRNEGFVAGPLTKPDKTIKNGVEKSRRPI